FRRRGRPQAGDAGGCAGGRPAVGRRRTDHARSVGERLPGDAGDHGPRGRLRRTAPRRARGARRAGVLRRHARRLRRGAARADRAPAVVTGGVRRPGVRHGHRGPAGGSPAGRRAVEAAGAGGRLAGPGGGPARPGGTTLRPGRELPVEPGGEHRRAAGLGAPARTGRAAPGAARRRRRVRVPRPHDASRAVRSGRRRRRGLAVQAARRAGAAPGIRHDESGERGGGARFCGDHQRGRLPVDHAARCGGPVHVPRRRPGRRGARRAGASPGCGADGSRPGRGGGRAAGARVLRLPARERRAGRRRPDVAGGPGAAAVGRPPARPAPALLPRCGSRRGGGAGLPRAVAGSPRDLAVAGAWRPGRPDAPCPAATAAAGRPDRKDL
ncbi:MAG: D-alanyl-D-alanine carboxypeptidase, partial [uncultured Frankineae bacterium]